MPIVYTEARKRANNKWRAKNRESINEYYRPKNLEYYYKNKEYLNARRIALYNYKKEINYDVVSKQFRLILLH